MKSWGVRDLRRKIAAKSFERSEIANLQLAANQKDLTNTFKDPYILAFLNLKYTYLEQDLGKAILPEMHKDGIVVAEFWIALLPKEELEAKLHQLLIEAKKRIKRNKGFKLDNNT